MSRSMEEAFLTALAAANKAEVEKENLTADYWEEAVKFIHKFRRKSPGVFLVKNDYWYNHVLYGLTRKRIRQIEYVKAGGCAFLRVQELIDLIETKNEMGIKTQILKTYPLSLYGVREIIVIALENL